MEKFSLKDVEEGLRGLRACLQRKEIPPAPEEGDLDILQLLVEHVRLGKILNGDGCKHTCNYSPSQNCDRCRVIGRMGIIEMMAKD